MRASVSELCLVVAGLVGCTAPETTLQIRMVADTHLNSDEQILNTVRSLELILDASGGFAGVSTAGQRFGWLTASDVDKDGSLELVYREDLAPDLTTLPIYRLTPGRNLNRSFAINVSGRAGESIVAVGGVSVARFYQGESIDVLVPFNLRSAKRAPRVISTAPNDEVIAPAALGMVTVEFSKEIAEGTLEAGARVLFVSGGKPQQVPGGWKTSIATVKDLGTEERRTVASFAIGCSLSPGQYRIEVGPEIKDLDGSSLDQDATTEQPDSFREEFTLAGTPGSAPCDTEPGGCQTDPDCNVVGSGYRCEKKDGGTYNVCVPVDSCQMLSCEKGYVCSPGPPAACVQNCALYGGCVIEKQYCDEKEGVCKDCVPGAPSLNCGTILERITCVFGSKTAQYCESSLGPKCSGTDSCVLDLQGAAGQKVTWKSSCTVLTPDTVLDGLDEYLKLDCSQSNVPVQPTLTEAVTCLFDSKDVQECYPSRGLSCKGVGSCKVEVTGLKGEQLQWKSTCGGYEISVVDGVDETVKFSGCP